MENRYTLRHTMDFQAMKPLFIAEGLEVKPDAPDPEGMVCCYELLDGEEPIGGAALVFTQQEFVLKDMAVTRLRQGEGHGRTLLEEVLRDAKARGGGRILLNAKVPEFYKKFGFTVMDRETAPKVSKCLTCPQFHNGCEAEIMAREL